MTRVWSIGEFALGLSRRVGEPTFVDVDHPDGGGACILASTSRLSDALHALAMLGHHVDPQGTGYWAGLLDALEHCDREAAVS